jgi:hypothetical protein
VDALPPEVQQCVAALTGGMVALVFEHTISAVPRATLHFRPAAAPPLTIAIEHLRDAAWGFAHAPALRVTHRYAGRVRAVRFATVRSFDPVAPGQRVRVEVEIEGSAPVALEGDALFIGPVPRPPPAPTPQPPPSTALLS